MKEARDIIISPIITEKSMDLMESNNTYTFQVAKDSNKVEIKNAIQEIFNVDVVNVNTMNLKGKEIRLGVHEGRRPDWKKALVKLAKDDEIEIFEGV